MIERVPFKVIEKCRIFKNDGRWHCFNCNEVTLHIIKKKWKHSKKEDVSCLSCFVNFVDYLGRTLPNGDDFPYLKRIIKRNKRLFVQEAL